MQRGIILILVSLLVCRATYCNQGVDIFESGLYHGLKGESLPYRFLQPINIIPGKRYPLVLFFHGAGERGTDNAQQLGNGVQLFIKDQNLENYPCFMLVPQCPKGLKWVDTDWRLACHDMPDTPSLPLRLSMELLDQFIKIYPIDTSRIYITGVSMGGFATWDAIQRMPSKFAAAAPVCGGADEKQAEKIKDIPIWAFHGARDRLIKAFRSENIIAAIRNAGGHPLFTEYPELGHNAWDSAYKDERILDWMFKQSLSEHAH